MKTKLFNALSLAVILAMLVSSLALADGLTADGDLIVVGNQTTINLGTVSPGAEITRSVSFQLVCDGKNHVDQGQKVNLTFSASGSTIPTGGSLSSTNTEIGPIPASWADDITGGGETNCPSPAPLLNNNGDAIVTITAPTSPGMHTFVVKYNNSLSPSGSGDPQAITGPTHSITYMLTVPSDTTAPTASPIQSPAANANGWNNSNVTVTWNWADNVGGSGINDANCTTSSISSGEGTINLSATCKDLAGNTGSASYTVKVDKTAPEISFDSPTTAAWYNANVTANWSCSDALSGVVSASVSASTTGEASSVPATGTCEDYAGNTANNTQYFKVDKTAPSISGSATPAANSYGWNNTDVLISFLCSDGLSGLSSCGPDVTLSAEGANQSATGNAADNAGNSASATVSGINIDKTAPTVSASASPAANGSGWNNSDVTVTFSGSDALSGIDSCDAPSVLSSDGAGQSASGACFDKAGNSASATASGIKIDKTAPAVTMTPVRSPDHNGWYNAPVDFDTAGSDATSGVASCSPLQNYSAPDGTSLTVNGSCTDFAGNTGNGTSDPFNFDNTDPSISVSLDRSPVGAWFNIYTGAPIAQFNCSDATSGYVSCPADYTFPQGADLVHEGIVYDNAGNSASARVNSVYVDLTAPSITWDPGVYANGSVFYFGFVPAYPLLNPCIAADALSGAASCAVTGFSTDIDTHTLIATAYDVAGNSTVETRSYEVKTWTFSGFYQPVDMGKLNIAKNGSTVPLKFEVFAGPTELTDVNFIKQTFVQTLTCGTGVSTDEIESYATGGTSLRYDAIGGQFIFNWQTPKKAGNCYRVTLTLQDGSKIEADFKLK